MQDLFSSQEAALSPLADRMRPRTLDEFIGQGHIVGPGRLLRRAIEADRMTSSIFYGPPGCGKTTLASIIAGTTHSAFVQLNAVTSGVADVRQVIKEAQDRRSLYGQATYLLLDECHRWSKSQSDSILPAIERGVVRFIGSTTENPLVSMTPAIVSRCRIFQFYPLGEADVMLAMRRALADRERGFGATAVEMDEEAMRHIARIANGDVRSALGALELAVLTTEPGEDGVIHITMEVAEESIQKPVIRCDESLYYDMLSAFCKSLRGSDADAAMAWFARLLYAGVDPRPRERGRGAGEPDGDAASGRRVAGARGGRPAGGAAVHGAGDHRHLRKPEIQLSRHGAGSIRRGRGKGRLRPRADPPAGYALRRARAAGQRRAIPVSARFPRPLGQAGIHAAGGQGAALLHPLRPGAGAQAARAPQAARHNRPLKIQGTH